ncbi:MULTISPECIES: SMI1/KNR4 family protein [Providencia]|uniref:SMI1/KNR4 family protein n=1 Tax=Providencia TaxID=586 RepID=UPI0034E5BB76
MPIQWEKGRGKMNPSQLDEFEVEYHISFPTDYKKLVIANNGGYPTKTRFNIENGREAIFESLINWDVDRKANIYFWMQNLKLDKVIPFGKDPFGNLICFDFRTSTEPSIKFWDHETDELYSISHNWGCFISSLRE